jgi:divalent metal cation (Fe/Co/Zn/Cd) transporter
MFTVRSFIVTVVLFFGSTPCFSETTNDVVMADAMRSNGKIYVVVAAVLIILSGLFIYLYRLERKIKKLEEGHK